MQAGQALLAIVGPETWVVANFKEGQLTRMRPGQEVHVVVDAIADHSFRGTVESSRQAPAPSSRSCRLTTLRATSRRSFSGSP